MNTDSLGMLGILDLMLLGGAWIPLIAMLTPQKKEKATGMLLPLNTTDRKNCEYEFSGFHTYWFNWLASSMISDILCYAD